ncbi:MAG: phenylacetate-CoA oxygenase subunit PaaI, partial [Elioraea sp.]|nr:phenylacetate-CoA oxygenase subunit PaaI [Elioraea sp.]
AEGSAIGDPLQRGGRGDGAAHGLGARRLGEQGVDGGGDAVRHVVEGLATVARVFDHALLPRPADGWMQTGGRSGRHTEHLGHMLAVMQHLQRAYPGCAW